MSAPPADDAPRAGPRVLGLSAVTLAGKLLALLKTAVIAALFGAGAALDAFWVAYSLPLLLPGILTTVVTVAFVPRFMRGLDRTAGPEAWRGANSLFTLILLLSLGAAALMAWQADALVRVLAPGLAPDAHAHAVELTRVLLPAVPLMTLSSLLAAISTARERFLVPALEGIVANVVLIACALTLAPRLGVSALVLGTLLGIVAYALLLAWSLRSVLARSIRPAFAWRHADFRAPLAHLLPLLLGSAGAMLTTLVNQYFLSRAGEGAISALNYALMFAYLPVEVFAQSVVTAVYPSLGRAFAHDDRALASVVLGDGVRLVTLLTLPFAVALVLLAQPLLVALLERGQFDPQATAATAAALQLLAAGVWFRAFAFLNYRVLHAALRPWLQVAIGALGVATNAALNAWLAERWGLRGIALATTLAMAQSALLSWLAVRVVLGLRARAGLVPELVRIVLAVLVFAAALLGGLALAHALGLPRASAAWVALAASVPAAILALGFAAAIGQRDTLAALGWVRALVQKRRSGARSL